MSNKITNSRKPHLVLYRASARSARRATQPTLKRRASRCAGAALSCWALRPATQLFIADHRQYWPQPLVVRDGARIDLTNLVEGAVGELDAFVTDRKSAIGIIDDSHPLSDRW